MDDFHHRSRLTDLQWDLSLLNSILSRQDIMAAAPFRPPKEQHCRDRRVAWPSEKSSTPCVQQPLPSQPTITPGVPSNTEDSVVSEEAEIGRHTMEFSVRGTNSGWLTNRQMRSIDAIDDQRKLHTHREPQPKLFPCQIASRLREQYDCHGRPASAEYVVCPLTPTITLKLKTNGFLHSLLNVTRLILPYIISPCAAETHKSTDHDNREGTKSDRERGSDGKPFRLLGKMNEDLPKEWVHRALWLWERPVMKLGRLTMFFAQLPAIFSFLASQTAFLVGQITLPMLPPLLLGAGILLRSIWVNAGYLFPRVSLTTLLLWGIWLLNSLIHRTTDHFTNQGIVSVATAHAIMNWAEAMTLVISGLVTLSLFGVNVSGLLLPAGICIALAAKDLAHNFLAGIVLFLAQPFRVGDQVSIPPSTQMVHLAEDGWYEGICERVDLRFTVLRKGKYRLHVPNAAFITKEFLVVDDDYEETEESSESKPDDRPKSGIEGSARSDSRVNGGIVVNGGGAQKRMIVPTELHLGEDTEALDD